MFSIAPVAPVSQLLVLQERDSVTYFLYVARLNPKDIVDLFEGYDRLLSHLIVYVEADALSLNVVRTFCRIILLLFNALDLCVKSVTWRVVTLH